MGKGMAKMPKFGTSHEGLRWAGGPSLAMLDPLSRAGPHEETAHASMNTRGDDSRPVPQRQVSSCAERGRKCRKCRRCRVTDMGSARSASRLALVAARAQGRRDRGQVQPSAVDRLGPTQASVAQNVQPGSC